MSDNPGNMNNLQLYNLSRSIGSKAISIVDESATVDAPTSKDDVDMGVVAGKYTSAKSQFDHWPFDSATDLVEIVLEETTVSGSPDELQDFSSVISNRLVDAGSDIESESESESTDSADQQQEESEEIQQNEQPTQSVGTSVQQTTEDNTDVEDGTEPESKSESVEPTSEEQPEADLETGSKPDSEDKTTESNSDSDTELDQKDSNTEPQSEDNLPPTEVSEVASEDGITMHVAADLYYHLLGNGEKTVDDLEEEYTTKFPDESVILTELFNTSGPTKERIREIESWVDQWYDDEDQVNRANNYNRKVMMLSGD